jgi:N-acetylmuramoyl-L-alanine amidase
VRELKRIILHCSATREGQDVDAATIRKWHLARGWSDIGYHYVIKLDGVVEQGRPLHRIGAHTKGHNADSIGICYIGGLDAQGDAMDTMTGRQRDAFQRLCYALCITFHQPFAIHGHNEFSPKACPSFEVADKFEWLRHWCFSYQQRYADQRPPTPLERAQHCARTDRCCGCGKCDC